MTPAGFGAEPQAFRRHAEREEYFAWLESDFGDSARAPVPVDGTRSSPRRISLRNLVPAGSVRTVTAVSEVMYSWHEAPVPEGLQVTQVYGYLLCPLTGRVLVQDDEGAMNLPGGTPEEWDEDQIATLIREIWEESQVRIQLGTIAYLGYQKVVRPERAPYAQVRMAGVIAEFAPRAPDPDGGRIYRRLMTSLALAPEILGWGEPAVLQCRAAARVARRWGLPVDAPAPDGYAD